LSATKPESRPEETTGPDADPAMSAAVAGSSNGAFAGNGLARQSPAGPEPDAEFLETFETERVDDNQPQLPFAPAGAATGGSSSAARKSLADQLSKAGGNGSAEDLVALEEIAAEPGAANGSAETFIVDRNIVDDLAEVMSAAAMPPEPPAFKADGSPPNRGRTQGLVPEPPRSRDRQLIIAVSEREIASAERTENTVSHARELVPGSDGASVGVKAHAKSKSKTSWATKHFGGFLKSSPDKLTKEDPVFSRHQPKIDIEKIAQHFSSGSKPRTKIS
jgi:hypothetical protein